jgi:hypothetical protein
MEDGIGARNFSLAPKNIGQPSLKMDTSRTMKYWKSKEVKLGMCTKTTMCYQTRRDSVT